MDSIRDHIESYVFIQQAPADWPGRAMMERRHGIHEMRHVLRAGLFRLIENIGRGARVPNRNDPAAATQLTNEFKAALNFWRDRHHVNRAISLDNGKIVQWSSGLEHFEVLTMQRPTLVVVDEWAFIVNTQHASA